ncbi:MAG: hypothetical protein ACRDT8_04320 [Micromonosporaceae bacterium]
MDDENLGRQQMNEHAYHYDGKRFRSAAAETAAAGEAPVGHYHQSGDLIWAEFSGGRVRRGSLVGTCDSDGTLSLAYCQVLSSGEVISGDLTSTPQLLADGRIRLKEQWRRHGLAAATGVSYIEELRH